MNSCGVAKKAGLTATELPRISGVGLNTISLVERAYRDVRISTILQLVQALTRTVELNEPEPRSTVHHGHDRDVHGYELED